QELLQAIGGAHLRAAVRRHGLEVAVRVHERRYRVDRDTRRLGELARHALHLRGEERADGIAIVRIPFALQARAVDENARLAFARRDAKQLEQRFLRVRDAELTGNGYIEVAASRLDLEVQHRNVAP